MVPPEPKGLEATFVELTGGAPVTVERGCTSERERSVPVDREHVEELVMAAKEGDPVALAEICEEFHPQVYRYMLRRAPAEEAEDLASEVCLRAVKALPRQRGFFPAWLYRIAANLLTDRHRRRAVRDEVPVETDALAGSTDAGAFARGANLRMDLEWAMEGLNEEQRELIHLRFVEGYDSPEIGEILGKSADAVRAQQVRALRALRARLATGRVGP